MVYVLDVDGKPLMPTTRHGKVRRLLKEGKAKVVKRCPFTIQLLYDSTRYVQEINLGIDAGSKHIGVSATTKQKVLYEADVELRNDIVDLISTRRECRRTRRNRKTRYRKARFNNRVSTKKTGWLAPSVKQKIQTHLTVINNVYKILPVKNLTVETASFDIQKIKNPDISGEEYQQGEQLNFWNVREYVLFRDGHTCQCCKGKSKDKILNVHHIESRKAGGNAPNNLITLCETCHKGYHNGTVKLPKSIHRGMSFRDATFMNTMRKTLLSELRKTYPNVKETYGYVTKNTRITHNLPKDHYVDARCISGNPDAKPLGYYFYQRKIRCHNRKLHKINFSKGGIRKIDKMNYTVKGFRLFDKVVYNGNEYFVFARRKSGSFSVRNFLGEKPNKSGDISYRKLIFSETRHSILTEVRWWLHGYC
jgi:hypothetical protein